MIYPVEEWKMTSQQLADYLKKHPIRSSKKETVITFSTDYKWRGESSCCKKEQFVRVITVN